MDPQIKKGSLELCILMMLHEKDCYGYEVSKEIGNLLEVKEGTIYLILQRLEKTEYVKSYIKESESSKPRKYYKLSLNGIKRMESLVDDYSTINGVINKYMKKQKSKGDKNGKKWIYESTIWFIR